MSSGLEMGLSLGVDEPDPPQAGQAAVRTEHRLKRGRLGRLGGGLPAPFQQGAGAGNIPLAAVVGQGQRVEFLWQREHSLTSITSHLCLAKASRSLMDWRLYEFDRRL